MSATGLPPLPPVARLPSRSPPCAPTTSPFSSRWALRPPLRPRTYSRYLRARGFNLPCSAPYSPFRPRLTPPDPVRASRGRKAERPRRFQTAPCQPGPQSRKAAPF
ncbi:hypothetical protein T492DRAFT_914776, partial [Pavlovales sp. CCMP2436]